MSLYQYDQYQASLFITMKVIRQKRQVFACIRFINGRIIPVHSSLKMPDGDDNKDNESNGNTSDDDIENKSDSGPFLGCFDTTRFFMCFCVH